MRYTVLDSGVQILGLHVFCGGVLDTGLSIVEVDRLPAVAVVDANTIRPGRV